MFSKSQNELLTRVGPGTPTGNLIRRYWVPALLAEELPEPDCPPVRVRLLGENLVAFRDTLGRVGLLEENCLHRGTSLYLGRNEQGGLRCIYHGWKFDVEGNVLEAPSEPPESQFRFKLRHKAYACCEVGGFVFTYMGPVERMPAFPNYEWTTVPPGARFTGKSLMECNYLQALEGDLDSAHLNFLHRTFPQKQDERTRLQDLRPVSADLPSYEIEETDFGVRLIAKRRAGPNKTYYRISSYVVPITTWVPPGAREVHFWVPIDDTHTWRYDFWFLDDDTRKRLPERLAQVTSSYLPVRNKSNDYLQDRGMQETVNFTGIAEFSTFLSQDFAATETMGRIYDRSKEHLGTSDRGLIAVRRFILKAVQAVQRGEEPPHLLPDPHPPLRHIDSPNGTLPNTVHWRDHFTHLAKSLSPEQTAPVG